MNNTGHKIFIRTFGCQMNERDSDAVAGMLLQAGFELTTEERKADVVIFNTCSVRQRAEDRVWSEVGRVFKQRRKGPPPLIGIIGCMAQNYGPQVFERAPGVGFAVGPRDLHKVPEIIRQLSRDVGPAEKDLCERKIFEVDTQVRPEEMYRNAYSSRQGHAYIVLSHGCVNFCTYCVVPYVRGPLVNRDFRDIIDEVKRGVDSGATRFTLLGQNVNAYQWEGVGFVELLKMVDSVPGVEEFGFMTSHPKDASGDLFRAIRDMGKLSKFLHLPFQSGSNRILELMNRQYTREKYLSLVDEYRSIVKGGKLSTDVIVGFPTETAEDFEASRQLLEQVRFDFAFLFKYSPRPHTKASAMADDVPTLEKERRHGIILELQRMIANEKRTDA